MHEPNASVIRTPADAKAAADRLRTAVHSVIVGQDRVIGEVLIALVCGGHALIEGVPGLAKTLLVSTLARSMSLGFARIQFTPDLMPSDMTGTEVIEEDRATGTRRMRFVPGPIFANVLLADEINRTPPKTQSALLEAMQERQVTVGGVVHPLPDPFFVLATQNPIEQEGTYPLPEAQLDRFMLQVMIGYPTEAEEAEIVRRTTGAPAAAPTSILSGDDVRAMRALVREVPVADHVARYALRLVRATRAAQDAEAAAAAPKAIVDYVSWGAGPRASQFLVLAAKARALLAGAPTVTPEDVRAVALPVLRHRIQLNFNAQADGVGADRVVQELLRAVPVEDAGAPGARELERLVRPGGGGGGATGAGGAGSGSARRAAND
ncbi:MAG: AAA family ATPase [Phycisphaerales bacterium]